MYISLYPARQLEKTKDTILWLGLFMMSGGLAALLNDVVLQEHTRWNWAVAACLISLVGVILMAVGTDKILLRDAYFSITPARLSYRLNLYSPERMIYWQQIAGIQISDRHILFDLDSGRQVLLRLGAIQSHNTAHHVAVSIQLAALERNVTINGVQLRPQAAGGAL